MKAVQRRLDQLHMPTGLTRRDWSGLDSVQAPFGAQAPASPITRSGSGPGPSGHGTVAAFDYASLYGGGGANYYSAYAGGWGSPVRPANYHRGGGGGGGYGSPTSRGSGNSIADAYAYWGSSSVSPSNGLQRGGSGGGYSAHHGHHVFPTAPVPVPAPPTFVPPPPFFHPHGHGHGHGHGHVYPPSYLGYHPHAPLPGLYGGYGFGY